MQRIFKYVLAVMATLLMPLAMLATAAPAQAAVSEVQVLNANIGGANVAGSGLYSNGLAPAGTLLRMMQDRPGLDAVTVLTLSMRVGPTMTGRILLNVATPDHQEKRWDVEGQRRITPSGKQSSGC